MRALGIDLGSKRIGIAISDSDGKVATPLSLILRSGDEKKDHQAIKEMVLEWEAEIVIVGMPYSLNGSLGPAAKSVEIEIKELTDTLPVPVQTYDERLTTVTAEQELLKQGIDAKRRRKLVDQVAASIILQAWLNTQSWMDKGDG